MWCIQVRTVFARETHRCFTRTPACVLTFSGHMRHHLCGIHVAVDFVRGIRRDFRHAVALSVPDFSIRQHGDISDFRFSRDGFPSSHDVYGSGSSMFVYEIILQ